MTRTPTPYQLEVLDLVAAGDPDKGDDRGIDFDQLLDRLSWTPTKAAAQFTIRALVGRDLIQKNGMVVRRGRRRVCFLLTEKGKTGYDPRGPLPPTVSDDGTSEVDPEVLKAVEDFDPGLFTEVIED